MDKTENTRGPYFNGEGYFDPTAHDAIRNIEQEELKTEEENEKFSKLLHTIFYLCELAGFRIEGRIVLVDKASGKIWR